MKLKYIIPATVLSTLFVAGIASAQVASGVNTTISPTTTTVTPGTSGQTIGTLSITGNPTGAAISSIPLTFVAGSGGSLNNLSNCQVLNASGQSITTGSNVVGTVGAGVNSFNLNNPVNVSSGAGTTTLSVRCDVAANTQAGSTFGLLAGTPVFTPSLNVNLDTAPSVPAGSQDVALANIFLGAGNSGAGINVSALPLSITAGNGASAANLSDCRLRDASNLGGSLSGAITPGGGTTVFSLGAPFTVFAGTSQMLSLTCDVSAATPTGGTFTVSINPANVTAVNASTGASITPSAVVGTGPNGLPASTSGTVIVSASTGTGGTGTGGTGTGGTGSGTPGIPNTGVGGAMQTMLFLAFSAFVAALGVIYLKRRTI